MINHTFLFIGYGVGDSNLKLIMKWVDNIVSRQKGDKTKRKKHLLSLLKAIVHKDNEVCVDDKKLDTDLLLWKGSAGSNIIEKVIRKSQKSGNTLLAVKARSFLKRLGAEGYRFEGGPFKLVFKCA